MPILRNGHRRFVGIDTLVALIVHSPSHVIIGYAAYDRVVLIRKSTDERRINLLVILFGHSATVYVVSGHLRTAGFPCQRGRVCLVRRLLLEYRGLSMARRCGVSVQNRNAIVAFFRVISGPVKEAKVVLSVHARGAEQ